MSYICGIMVKKREDKILSSQAQEQMLHTRNICIIPACTNTRSKNVEYLNYEVGYYNK